MSARPPTLPARVDGPARFVTPGHVTSERPPAFVRVEDAAMRPRHGIAAQVLNGSGVKKVLIVDDEPTLREVVSALLIDEGYDVVAASDGRMALDLLTLERPDLILMDVWMPGLNGHDVYRAIRSRADVRHIPVVMMSAAATRASLDPSISGYLPKPFDLDRLLAIITQLIGPPTGAAPL